MKVVLAIVVVVAVALAEEKYSTENDNFDVEALVSNAEKLREFTDCFLDKKACFNEAKSFKEDISNATQTACARCTDAQKHLFKRYLEGVKQKFPEDYEAFKTKYDPESKYFSALEAAIANS